MAAPDTRVSLILRLPDAGDAEAWNEFVGLYRPLIFSLARRGGLQPADAEELTQRLQASDRVIGFELRRMELEAAGMGLGPDVGLEPTESQRTGSGNPEYMDGGMF